MRFQTWSLKVCYDVKTRNKFFNYSQLKNIHETSIFPTIPKGSLIIVGKKIEARSMKTYKL